MRSHVNSASIELWRIIQAGYKAVDPNNSLRTVDSQNVAIVRNAITPAKGWIALSMGLPHDATQMPGTAIFWNK